MPIAILSGPVGTGKSAALRRWTGELNERGQRPTGLVNPTVDGDKVFQRVTTGERLPMRLKPPFFIVGKYEFSQHSFDVANEWLRAEFDLHFTHFVFDEVGLLELEEKGLFMALKEVLSADTSRASWLIFVVRDSLLVQVRQSFLLEEALVIDKSELNRLWI